MDLLHAPRLCWILRSSRKAVDLSSVKTQGLAAVLRRQKLKASKGRVFVEFCCAVDSQLKRVCKKLGIQYLGLSLDWVDLRVSQQMDQIVEWARFQTDEQGVELHLFASLPCTVWSSLQQLNLFNFRMISSVTWSLGDKNRSPSWTTLYVWDTSLNGQGVSVSFEWPKGSSVWHQPKVLQMMVAFDLFSSCPTGCGFKLCIKGRNLGELLQLVSGLPRT